MSMMLFKYSVIFVGFAFICLYSTIVLEAWPLKDAKDENTKQMLIYVGI